MSGPLHLCRFHESFGVSAMPITLAIKLQNDDALLISNNNVHRCASFFLLINLGPLLRGGKVILPKSGGQPLALRCMLTFFQVFKMLLEYRN